MADKAIAMDKSMRSFDGNGHLIVERTIITKAAVNPYLGHEIPNYERLGLEPERIYHLLRDREELKKALPSFNGVQLLLKHTPVSAEEPHNEITVGTVIAPEMEGDVVYASLRIFDKDAIALIESEKLNELSSGYAYTADMTAGEFEGQKYDGVMRQIHGNHVAIVEHGRIGKDAIIADSLPTQMEFLMKLKNGALSQIADAVKTSLGMDSDIPAEALGKITKAVLDNALPDDPKGKDEAPEKDGKAEDEEEVQESTQKAQDEEEESKDPPKAKDEESESKEKDKPAMDADTIRAEVAAQLNALWQARKEVEPLVGMVAMDSAEAVYAYALQQKGVSTKGVHPSAYKSMVQMLLDNNGKSALAMDGCSYSESDSYTDRFK